MLAKQQASRMGNQKWHLLYHIVKALHENGALAFLHNGLYLGSYKSFKNVFRKSFKRRVSAMDEDVSRNSHNLEKEISKNKTVTVGRRSTCKMFPI